MKKGKVFSSFCTAALVLISTIAVAQEKENRSDQPAIDIRPSESTSIVNRIDLRLEGKGSVIPDADRTLPLKLDARFQYEQRIITRSATLKSVRNYDVARAEIRLGKGSLINQLDSSNRLILCQVASKQKELVQIAGIQAPITQSEFELINTPAHTLILPRFFARENVTKNERWKADSEALAQLLNVDMIEENDVHLKLTEIQGSIAEIHVSGDIQGYIDGAKTEINISATAKFDTSRGEVGELLMTINQRREIGQMSPGLQAVFKLRAQSKRITKSTTLDNESLAKIRSNGRRITDGLVLHSASGSFDLVHPRAWRVIADTSERSVLRYIDAGRMLGQVDIIPLPRRQSDQTQTLEQFKNVVQSKLAESQAVIVNAHQGSTRSGQQWLRVEATGRVNEINLHWIYYTLTNGDGQRVQLVFTVEPQNAEDFAGIDQSLLGSVSFPATPKTPAQNASSRNPQK